MDTSRQFNTYELRNVLDMKQTEIDRLRKENIELRAKNQVLCNWNVAWQKHRWNEALLERCEGLEQEIKGLSNIQTRILVYLSRTHDANRRHVRAVSRAMSISPSTAHHNLAVLAGKRLIRCYLRGSHLKKYYTLPEAQDLVQWAFTHNPQLH